MSGCENLKSRMVAVSVSPQPTGSPVVPVVMEKAGRSRSPVESRAFGPVVSVVAGAGSSVVVSSVVVPGVVVVVVVVSSCWCR